MANYSESKPELGDQPRPGLQKDLKDAPIDIYLPTPDGGKEKYKAAGKLKGKRALITGGDSGIGRSTAFLFAMEGAEVAINYLPKEQPDAEDTLKAIHAETGKTIHLIPLDIKGYENAGKIVQSAIDALGGLDILFNNAGTQLERETFAELPPEQVEDTFATNALSMFYITQHALKHIKKGGSIVNCASVNHYVGKPKLIDYSATKGAIIAFTRSLTEELGEKGIRINAVAPGPIHTPLIEATMGKESKEGFDQMGSLQRAGQPVEVATCVVFLAGPDASFISGQTLHPNGGVIVGS